MIAEWFAGVAAGQALLAVWAWRLPGRENLRGINSNPETSSLSRGGGRQAGLSNWLDLLTTTAQVPVRWACQGAWSLSPES